MLERLGCLPGWFGYAAGWLTRALLVKNAFFYKFVAVRFESEEHVLVILISALLVKNAFFDNFLQCALNKKRMF